MAIGFANGDSSGATTIYYVDNVKGSINQYINPTTANKGLVKTSSTSIPTDESQIEQNDSPAKVYPNPVTNSFSLSKGFNSVTIYTITGEKIVQFSGNQNIFEISNLNSGFYIIRASDNEGNNEVIRFLKN